MAEHDVATLAGSVNAFGYTLYRALPDTGNCLCSPVSVASALAALVPGARGETARELLDVLKVGDHSGAVAATFGELLAALFSRRSGDLPDEASGSTAERRATALRSANALVTQSTFPVLRTYRDTLEGYFRAVLFALDFADPAVAAGRVNQWVARQTGGLIDTLLDPATLSSNTRLAVLNAVCFLGTWSRQFEASDTSERVFHLLPGSAPSEVPVPMMHQTEEFPHVVDDTVGFEAIQLPYEGRVSMVLVVPHRERFASVATALDDAMVNRILGALQPREIALGVPRFEIEERYQLAPALQALGIRRAFEEEHADFSGITDAAAEFWVSGVTHHARVRVHEHGTEAAAVTAVELQELGMAVHEGPHPLLIDRPFLFVIRDDDTGAALFLGRVVDPRG